MIRKIKLILSGVDQKFNKQGNRVYWIRLLLTLFAFIALSFIFVSVLNLIKVRFEIDLYAYNWVAYIAVFTVTMAANLTIVAPVPFSVIVMATAASKFDPFMIGICAAAGGTLGEMSGYFAGWLGKKIAIPDSIAGYRKIEYWVNKYGVWAIFILAVQPIIPFDIGGLIAGTARMHLARFLPSLFAGKLIKYVLISVVVHYGLQAVFPSWMIP
jgi:membrane protein YqaA with SNARE-associated domain